MIEPGDLVICDFDGRYRGYFSDVTRTFSVGEPTSEQVEVHSLVLAANTAGHAVVEPGVAYQEVDRAARKVIDDAGYGELFIIAPSMGSVSRPTSTPTWSRETSIHWSRG